MRLTLIFHPFLCASLQSIQYIRFRCVNLLVFLRDACILISNYPFSFSRDFLHFSDHSSSKSLENLYINTIISTISINPNTILANKNCSTDQRIAKIAGKNSVAITPAMILFFISYLLPTIYSVHFDFFSFSNIAKQQLLTKIDLMLLQLREYLSTMICSSDKISGNI